MVPDLAERPTGGIGDPDAIDSFASGKVLGDPYPFCDALRDRCPVHQEPHHEVVMVSGYAEALEVFRNVEAFSSANSVTGPFPGFPVALKEPGPADARRYRYLPTCMLRGIQRLHLELDRA